MLRQTGAVVAVICAAALAFTGAGAAAQDAATAPAGHDLVLRQLILQAARGEIRFQRLTPQLAAAVRPQASVAQKELSALGPLKTVTFEKVNASGQEIYRAVFANGALDWAFSVDDHGLISNALYRAAAPDPS